MFNGFISFLLLVPFALPTVRDLLTSVPQPPVLVLQPQGTTECAPHGEGNIYAPCVLVDDGRLRMWYGGQGKDGHDRIHLAESMDGREWTRRGVVLDNEAANHVNDPAVVKVGHQYLLWYTEAGTGVIDDIRVASSNDGVHWERKGLAVPRGAADAWDAAIVGRPAVLWDQGRFRLWYDGRSDGSRSVGHAISMDGLHWTKDPTVPVFGSGAGGIDVQKLADGYVMLYESREGTHLAISGDGSTWTDRGLWLPKSGEDFDRYGQVTPFLFLSPTGSIDVYFGAAARTTWDGNAIYRIALEKHTER